MYYSYRMICTCSTFLTMNEPRYPFEMIICIQKFNANFSPSLNLVLELFQVSKSKKRNCLCYLTCFSKYMLAIYKLLMYTNTYFITKYPLCTYKFCSESQYPQYIQHSTLNAVWNVEYSFTLSKNWYFGKLDNLQK